MAERTLKEALKHKPVYPSVYNLLAYYYAQTKQKLNYAQELIEQALQHRPLSASYLDTKGFILMQQGKKGDALPVFQKVRS